MTTTVLRAVRLVENKIDKFRDDHQTICHVCEAIDEVLRFSFFLLGPILLPFIIMYMEARFQGENYALAKETYTKFFIFYANDWSYDGWKPRCNARLKGYRQMEERIRKIKIDKDSFTEVYEISVLVSIFIISVGAVSGW